VGLFGRATVAALSAVSLAAPVSAFESPVPAAHAVDCSPQAQAIACQAKKRQAKKNEKAAQADSRDDQQRALVQAAVAALAPQRKGIVDLYTIGVAGWASQDVFVKELEGALSALGKTLPTGDRMLRLINHPSTSGTPLASRDNLAAAVRGIGKIMDKNEDVLILFMTSHGSREGFALQLPGAIPIALPPGEVATILTGAGIRNRVVIVSACYSGIFVKPVANDNTIVMTAADETHPSFGCAPEREWTYFGDAFFNRSLRPGMDFRRAFNSARTLISEWELMGNLPPSNPQGHFGQVLVEKLTPLFAIGAHQ